MSSQHPHNGHCLNCGQELTGRYCSNCGQDSQEHHDSIWHLLQHFLNDITHYDGKFWKTLKPLLFSPGILTTQYLQGKRASYLNPVRMFIFLNFIFFLLIAWLPGAPKTPGKKQPTIISIDTIGLTAADYDSIQKTLLAETRDSKIKQAIIMKAIGITEKVRTDPHYIQECNEVFVHNMARLTFLFLLVCTGLLSLLYYRAHLLTISHALFAIHLSCTFLLLSVLMLLALYVPLGSYISTIIFLYGNYYLYRSMRIVYKQGFGKTAIKFILLELLLAIVIGSALLVNALYVLTSVKG